MSVKRDRDGNVGVCDIFNAGDVSVEGIPNAPKIDTLPEWISIDEDNYIWDRDMDSDEGELNDEDDDNLDDEDNEDWEDNDEPAAPPAPPAYTPVEVDITSEDISYEFEARSAEEGLAAIGAEILSNELANNNAYVVRTADGHITVALYQPQTSRGSIVLAPSSGRYYLLSFTDVDSAVDFLRANMGNVRSSDEIDANGNEIAREELKSSCSLHEAFAYLKHLED